MKSYCEESVFKKPMKKSNQHHPPVHNLGKKSMEFGRKFVPTYKKGGSRGKKMDRMHGREGVGKHRIHP